MEFLSRRRLAGSPS